MNSVLQRRKMKGLQLQAVALLFFSLVTSVHAADFSVSARQVKSAKLTTGGATVDYSLQAKFAQGNPRYASKKVSYTPGKIISLANARKATNPAAAAVNAVVISSIAAAGWAIDELTEQVTTPGTIPDDYQQGYYWCVGSYSQKRCAGNPSGAIEVFYSQFDGWSLDSYYPLDQGDFYIDYLLNTTNPDGHSGSSTNRAKRVSCADGSSYCDEVPVSPGEPVAETDWWPVVSEAIETLSPEAQREFWNNIAGLPELTPELQSALNDWQNGLETETGLAGESVEETTSDIAQDVQDVRLTNPIELSDSSMPSDISSSISGEYTGTEFTDREGDIQDIVSGTTTAPSLIWDPSLPATGSCQQISVEWMGETMLVPGVDACANYEIFKEMLGWLLYMVTAWMCIEIFFKSRTV